MIKGKCANGLNLHLQKSLLSKPTNGLGWVFNSRNRVIIRNRSLAILVDKKDWKRNWIYIFLWKEHKRSQRGTWEEWSRFTRVNWSQIWLMKCFWWERRTVSIFCCCVWCQTAMYKLCGRILQVLVVDKLILNPSYCQCLLLGTPIETQECFGYAVVKETNQTHKIDRQRWI